MSDEPLTGPQHQSYGGQLHYYYVHKIRRKLIFLLQSLASPQLWYTVLGPDVCVTGWFCLLEKVLQFFFMIKKFKGVWHSCLICLRVP